MSDISSNNKRIAKNALLLYFRMLFMMAVSLYTSRIVLNVLGVDDYGIYNVVGGIVVMFAMFNNAMSSSTQRYITFELGKGNVQHLQKVFLTSVNIHLLIALVIFLLGETIGLWFLHAKIVIPPIRMNAALWVYQFSMISMMVMIVNVPYNAAIIAHEKMSVFAYISILEVLLKLGLVYLLYLAEFDKLIVYAALLCGTQVLISFVYKYYCNSYFRETHYKWIWNHGLFKEMLNFAGWNLWGNCAGIFYTQGLNILLNIFFGPAVNAARGIAVQVQGAVAQFSVNFQTALNPQITKSYAMGDLAYMHSLIFRGSKFTFLLLTAISFPVLFETDVILKLWLKTVPNYTVIFVRLMLCITIIDAMASAFMVAVQATGRVRFYQFVVGAILLTIVPISYIVLKWGAEPWSVFFIHLCICIVAFIVRLFIVRSIIHFSLRAYFHQVLLRCLLVLSLAIPLPIILCYVLSDNLVSSVLIGITSVFMILLFSYIVGLSFDERQFVMRKISLFMKFVTK